jgi:ribosomal protein L40E
VVASRRTNPYSRIAGVELESAAPLPLSDAGWYKKGQSLGFPGKAMRCQNCSAENPQGAKFCIQCAAPFQRRCQKCGSENPPEARFCAQCASSLTGAQVGHSKAAAGPTSSGIRITLDNPEPRALDGERKTVTALFADIRGSTELTRDLDPEEARAIVDRCCS